MILVSEPVVGPEELANITDCLVTGWISSAGKYIDEFESSWSTYCGMKHGVAVSNGTAALEIAVACLDLEKGSEIILPSFTIISCAQAITNQGMVPVVVDCELDTWCMDVSKIEEKITSKTKAIMPVHMYGHPVDMDPLIKLAEKYDLRIIEDAAEVHGGEYKGRKCGGMGDISTFSFYANKLITTGEGGMVLTNNDEYANRARSLRNLCFERERRFKHNEIGFNYRMTNMQAALGVAQVKRIESIVEKKRDIADYYTQHLKFVESIQLPIEKDWAKNVYWVYGIILNSELVETAVTLAAKLREVGIETRPFFVGMHDQPVFKNQGLFLGEHYPNTEMISDRGLYIPSGLNLTQVEQDKIIKELCRILVQ